MQAETDVGEEAESTSSDASSDTANGDTSTGDGASACMLTREANLGRPRASYFRTNFETNCYVVPLGCVR